MLSARGTMPDKKALLSNFLSKRMDVDVRWGEYQLIQRLLRYTTSLEEDIRILAKATDKVATDVAVAKGQMMNDALLH